MESPESDAGVPPPVAPPEPSCELKLQQRFADLIQATEKDVFALLHKRLRDSHTAWDLTQQTYVQAWEARDTFNPSREFRPWVMKIAQNVLTDHFRSTNAQKRGHAMRPRQLAPVTDSAVDGRNPREPVQPVDGLIRDESVEALRRVADHLSPKERELYDLRLLQGLSFDEIVKRTGRTKKSIGPALTRIRAKLKDQLPPDQE